MTSIICNKIRSDFITDNRLQFLCTNACTLHGNWTTNLPILDCSNPVAVVERPSSYCKNSTIFECYKYYDSGSGMFTILQSREIKMVVAHEVVIFPQGCDQKLIISFEIMNAIWWRDALIATGVHDFWLFTGSYDLQWW